MLTFFSSGVYARSIGNEKANIPNATQPTLERRALIIVSRHGIRVPYAPDGGAKIYSKSPGANWFSNASDWGATGEAYLTRHGEAVLGRMGEYYRQELVDSGFVSSDGSDVTVYTDHGTTLRCLHTARSFLGGMLPGVDLKIHVNETWIPQLFNQGGHPGANNTACAGPFEAQVLGTIGGDPAKLSQTYRGAIERFSDAINCCQASVCQPSGRGAGGACDLMGQPTGGWTGHFWSFFTGPFFTAASLSEYVQLVYMNNMSLSSLGTQRIGGDF